MGLSWSFREADNNKCPYNPGVECGGASPRLPGEASAACRRCGWNPDVRRVRVKKWKQANADKDFSQVVARIRRHGRR